MAHVALVVASGFEQAQMTVICKALAQAGHEFRLVSPKKQSVRAWDNTHWGGDVPVDVAAIEADAGSFDALVLPGGLIGADTLRSDRAIIELAAECAAQGKPVAALGHAVWVLAEAGLLEGRRATSHPAIRTDVENAGARWIDDAAVADSPIITGRHAHDVDSFIDKVIKELQT